MLQRVPALKEILRQEEEGKKSLTANSIIFHESTWQEATTCADLFSTAVFSNNDNYPRFPTL